MRLCMVASQLLQTHQATSAQLLPKLQRQKMKIVICKSLEPKNLGRNCGLGLAPKLENIYAAQLAAKAEVIAPLVQIKDLEKQCSHGPVLICRKRFPANNNLRKVFLQTFQAAMFKTVIPSSGVSFSQHQT